MTDLDPVRQATARSALRALIPAWYKSADALHPDADDKGIGPLQALLGILADQGTIVEEDIARLYDNWFIETCDDWVVPYIGALVRARPLPSSPPDGQRGYVANTLEYRRAKGTPAVLEQLARDVTGWPSLASESFRGLALTQSVHHVRPGRHGTADIRNATRASAAGTPFDAFSHTIEVRRPGVRGSRWSIPAIALFLWRQQAALLQAVEAVPDPAAPWLFHADPERRPRPWLNASAVDSDVDRRSHEPDLPVLLRRRAVGDVLRGRRLAIAAGETPPTDYFGDPLNSQDAPPAFLVEVQDVTGGVWRPIAPEAIRMVNLAGDPAAAVGDPALIVQPVKPIPAREGGSATFPDAELLIDPALGRVAIPAAVATPVAMRTSHFQGFGARIGAGPFDRNADLAAMIKTIGGGSKLDWQASVMKGRANAPLDHLFGSLTDAVNAWSAWCVQNSGAQQGLILIEDSAEHDLGGALPIPVPASCGLIIAAGGWPADLSKPMIDRLDKYEATACRPHITGDLAIQGGQAARIGLSGIFQTGQLKIAPGKLDRFIAHDCTFDVDKPVVAQLNTELAIEFARCLTGPLQLVPLLTELKLASSIVHAPPGGVAITGKGARLTIESSTVIGETNPVRELWASNSLFTARVNTLRTQLGCTRFCYVPPGSRTPRLYRCQPKLAVDAGAPPVRVKPHLVSLDRASPWYAQLHPLTHPALRKGGDDGGEIGAFRAPSSVLLEANVGATFDEYLRLGMTAGQLIAT